MDILATLAEAKASPNVPYHEFISQYSSYKKIIFGFIEGKDDPSFYKNFIDSRLPRHWNSCLIQAGNKKQVIEIYSRLKWSSYKRNQVLFFVDRDLSDYIDEQVPTAKNIYITDGYSIENSILSPDTFERGLRELLGFSDISRREMERLKDVFLTQREFFYTLMIPVMSQILFWRMNGIKVKDLDEIKIKHFIRFEKEKLIFISRPDGFKSFRGYLVKKCNPTIRQYGKKAAKESIFCGIPNWSKNIRGKYALAFLVGFMNHIQKNWQDFGLTKAPTKPLANLHANNAIAHLGTRTRIPESLDLFLQNTMMRYIKQLR